MNRLARICLVAAAAAVSPFATSVALGADAPVNIALANETVARNVTLPTSDPGLLTITFGCDQDPCQPPITAMTTGNTLYELEEELLTAAQLRSLFTSNPDTAVLVVLDTDGKHVKRVHMWAPPVKTPVNGPAKTR